MSSSDARATSALAWLFGTAALAAAALLLATWLVDPLGQLPGARLCAPGMKRLGDEPRDMLTLTRQPREVFLGTSRVARGFAHEDVEALLDGPAANLGLSAASMAEVDRLARHALRNAPVWRLWIGLDFGQFGETTTPGRALEPRDEGLSPRAAALRRGLLDPEAARATLRLALEPGRCARPEAGRGGFPFRGPARERGADAPAFAHLTERVRREMRQRAASANAAAYRADLARLAALLDDARRHGIQVVVFVNPSHPAYLQAVAEAGLEPRYQHWMESVARISRSRARFMDATGFAPVPQACAATGRPPCPFIDPVHYRPEVGRRILEATLDPSRGAGSPGFGSRSCPPSRSECLRGRGPNP